MQMFPYQQSMTSCQTLMEPSWFHDYRCRVGIFWWKTLQSRPLWDLIFWKKTIHKK